MHHGQQFNTNILYNAMIDTMHFSRKCTTPSNND